MNTLSWLAVGLGAVMLALYVPMVIAPASSRKAWLAFPRHRPSAWVLTAIALVWSAVYLYQMPLGGFERWKPLLYVLTPAAFLLIVFFADELLSVRALGALMLLLPTPLLFHARQHESGWSYVITVLAYLMVIKGMLLVLNPYLLRRWIERHLHSDVMWRLGGAAGTVVAALLAGLGMTAFRG